MKGPDKLLTRSWASIITIAVIAGWFCAPAQSQGIDVALLLQQTPAEGGAITPRPGVHLFALNSEVVLTATANPGYEFIYWLGDVSDPTANRTIAYLNKPKIIIAIFAPTEYGTFFVSQAAGGRLVGGGLVAAAMDYGWWGQMGLTSSGFRPSSSGTPPLYHQVVEPLPPSPESPVSPEPPIPEPTTGILLLLGGLFAIARRGTRTVSFA